MDVSRRVILLFIFVAGCSAQGEEPEVPTVTVEGPQEYHKEPGESVMFKCTLNKPIVVLMNYDVMWIHVPLYKPSEPETESVLLTRRTLSANADPERMVPGVDYIDGPTITYTITINNLKASDDGKYICRAASTNNDIVVEKAVAVAIKSDVQYVEMMFDGEGPIRGEDPMKLTRDQGKFDVTCTAGGFSDNADMHLFLGETEVPIMRGATKLDQKSSTVDEAVRRKVTGTVSNLGITGSSSNKRLRCQARATQKENAQMVESSVELVIISVEPVIKCDNNVSAWTGDLYIDVSCIVDHKGIDIDDFSWTIGESGVRIFAHNSTTDDEVHIHDLGNEKTKVTLNIYQLSDYHFDSVLYLNVHTTTGQTFREEAKLNKLMPTDSAAVSVAALWQLLVLPFGLLLSRL